MLVLSRKVNQSITVGDVTFTITRINGQTVRVGVDAPKERRILRSELEERPTNKKEAPMNQQ